MGLLDKVKNVFKKRRFDAATASPRLYPVNFSNGNVNADLEMDWIALTMRARNLAKNNEFVSGYLANIDRNVIGAEGFSLQSRASTEFLRDTIKQHWNDYQSAWGAYVTLDERGSGRDFDALIQRSLLVDGEAFIRLVEDPESPYLYRYELLDPMQITPMYNIPRLNGGGQIIMGVEFDARGREVAYYYRELVANYYSAGYDLRIPASEIIHLYKRNFVNQARGYSSLAPAILNLSQMDEYKQAEVIHARIQACTMAVWEQNGQPAGDLLDETDQHGEFVREMKPGIFPVAPKGYTAKTLSVSSPSGQFAMFWKAMLRSIANSLGISYNKAAGDYESVNYSSLREATLEDRASFEEMQRYLIENWKSRQFRRFVYALAVTGRIAYNSLDDAGRHRFFGKRFPWVDPVKELAAKEKEFDLLLTDPLTALEERGIDPVELLDRWATWNQMLQDRNIPFAVKPPIEITQNEVENE